MLPSWTKFAMLFVMGLVIVIGLGDNSGVDAGWFPGKLAGRVVVNGIHRRQERRAARRGCGAEAVEAVQASGCHAQASATSCHGPVEYAPAPVSQVAPPVMEAVAPAPVKVEADLSPEEEQRIRESIADLRDKLHLLEQMIEIRKQLTVRTEK